MLVRPSDIGCHLRQCLANTITFLQFWTNVEDVWRTLYKFYANVLCLLGAVNNLGGHFFRISELEVGTNCYERKQDIQQWPPSPKNKNKCSMVNKLHPVVLQSRPISYTSGAKNIIHEL